MKITSLHQLDYGQLSIEAAYSLTLTPASMAMLTDYDQTQLEGFFGAPSSEVGTLALYHDDDLAWHDIAECMDGSHEAIIPIQYDTKWLVDPKIDDTDVTLGKIIDAMNELKSRHYWTGWDFHNEDGIAFRTLDRFARLHGYICHADSLPGTMAGDDLDVLHIIPIDRDRKHTALYCEVAPYWEGNAFTVHVILESPFADVEPFNEMLGFVVGRDQYILDTAAEMVTGGIVQLTR